MISVLTRNAGSKPHFFFLLFAEERKNTVIGAKMRVAGRVTEVFANYSAFDYSKS